MKIYTKTGDAGETALYGGARVGKDSLRVWSYGSVDELTCALGMVAAHLQDEGQNYELKEIIRQMQQELFILGAELASDEKGLAKLNNRIEESHITELEKLIDELSEEQGNYMKFTMPGESVANGLLHVARATARRAERYVVQLSREEEVSPPVLSYLNRLSDALYVLSNCAKILP